jgi:hypothetical protein
MLLTVLAGVLVAGLRGAAIAAVIVPACGFAALAWHDRWARFREDARLFFRVLSRRDHQQRLARDRAQLAAEFDHIVEEAGVLEPG